MAKFVTSQTILKRNSMFESTAGTLQVRSKPSQFNFIIFREQISVSHYSAVFFFVDLDSEVFQFGDKTFTGLTWSFLGIKSDSNKNSLIQHIYDYHLMLYKYLIHQKNQILM